MTLFLIKRMFPEHLEGKERFLPGCSVLDADTKTEGAELLPPHPVSC